MRPDPDFALRPLDLDADVALIQAWYQLDYAHFWNMQGLSVEQTRDFYREAARDHGLSAWLGLYRGEPAFVMECYDPHRDPLGERYAVQPGDVGMHFFVGPARERRPGFTLGVLRAVMHHLFAAGARRVVVEPDIRNAKVHRLNRAVGFVDQGPIAMPSKTALLAFCTPADFARSLEDPSMSAPHPAQPASVVSHLAPDVWARVNRHLVRKALAEYAHEQVFTPEPLGAADTAGWRDYELRADDGAGRYLFRARGRALRHWEVDAASIRCERAGVEQEGLDALDFIVALKDTLGIPADKLPVYLDEISSTLYGAAYKQQRAWLSAAQLADADYQTLEAAMTEGHPGFVANNGRLGFDAFDYHAYAPETGSRFTLVWLAVHRERAHFAAVPGLDEERLLREELGEQTVAGFRARLRERGLAPDDYLFMPTHPWQWANKLSVMFAADVANQLIVPLERSADEYVAQQSVRTYFNMSQPRRCYVKTSLSVLNMGFMRGLSPYYMAGTPAINAYLDQLIGGDPVLRDYGFSILREVASVGYRNRYYEAALTQDSPYKKMLSVLWRESPLDRLQPGERLMTMAGLLHVDPAGAALMPELMRRSGLTPVAWLRQYLAAFLQPLVHCFYAHHLVFMPHGENLILVLRGHVPVRAIMKDIAEESAILDKDAVMPKGLERLAVDVPEDYKILGIFIDVFDGVFRHMPPLLEAAGCMDEATFWRTVAESVAEYQAAHPELNERFARYDFFAPTFLHSCLNRLQLKNNLQMVDLANPAGSLIMADPLDNPVAPYAPART